MENATMIEPSILKKPGRSLRWVLILPFSVQILAAVGLTGYLSLRNGEKAVNDMAVRLGQEASGRVGQHLDSYLALPPKINQINQTGFRQGQLSVQNSTALAQSMCQQMQVFNIGYNSFATPQGQFIGIERLDNGNLLINEIASKGGQMSIYQAGADCSRLNKIETKSDYNPLEESWYSDPVQAKKALWSSVYNWGDKPEVMSVAASYPMYDNNRQLQGVFSVDLILTQVRDFLQKLKVSPNARTFLMEADGMMIASSAKEQPFKLVDGKAVRLKASDSKDAVIKGASDYLNSQVKDLKQIATDRTLETTIDGKRHFLHIAPWNDSLGLKWFVVVAIPEDDFLGQIQASTRQTIVLCFLALLATLGAGLLTARRITRPVQQLSEASESLADGNWQEVPLSNVKELDVLANSFNRMSEQLQLSLVALQSSNQSLEGKVSAQKGELVKMLQDLEKTQSKQANSQSEFEQMANMVASRMQSPLNATQESLLVANRHVANLTQVIEQYESGNLDAAKSWNVMAMLQNLQNQLSTIEQSQKRLEDASTTLSSFRKRAVRR
jgi:methyl-accepting chemotaxis protein